MPLRLCLESSCGNEASYRGRCTSHTRTNERATHPNKALYSSKRWQTTRRHVLHEHPLCQCPNPACTEIATDVDHITPIEQGGDPWARANLQALAASCHSRKTRQEQATQ